MNIRRGVSGSAPWLFVVSCLFVAGCGAKTYIQTNKAADYRGNPRTLFVEEAFATRTSGLRTAFQDRFDTALRDCGVTPTFFSRDLQPAGSLQLNAPPDPQIAAMRDAVARTRPDTLLSVSETRYGTQGSSVISADFQLELTDAATRRQVWKAKVTVLMSNSPNLIAGADFADNVVTRMQADGILRVCGQGGASSPARAEAAAQPALPPPPAPASPPGKATTYKYGDQSYRTAADMLDARRADLAAKTSAVPKEPQPLRGRALIVLPTVEALALLNADTAKLLGGFGLPPDVLIDFNRIDLYALADAVVKAQLFEKASVTEQADTTAPSIGAADYLVWYRVRRKPEGGWVGEWMARPSASATPALVILPKDGAGQTPFYAAFVQNLRSALAKRSASRS